MEPIRAKIRQRWREDERKLAKRLTDIVVGSHHNGPYWLAESPKWQLDDGNNWWMVVDGDDVVINYRYSKNMTPEQWDALKLVINWALND